MFRLLSVYCLSALLVVLCGVLFAYAGSETPTDIEAAWRALRRSSSLQTELPGAAYGEDRQLKRPAAGALPWLPANLARLLLFGSLAFILLLLFRHLRGNLRIFSRAGALTRAGPAVDAPDARNFLEQTQAEAEELAGAGNFAEAMHVLLLQSLNELRSAAPVAASLTSREILRRPGLSAAARDALAEIIDRVEISYFGPHQPAEEEYRACRRSFAAFGAALGQMRRV